MKRRKIQLITEVKTLVIGQASITLIKEIGNCSVLTNKNSSLHFLPPESILFFQSCLLEQIFLCQLPTSLFLPLS